MRPEAPSTVALYAPLKFIDIVTFKTLRTFQRFCAVLQRKRTQSALDAEAADLIL